MLQITNSLILEILRAKFGKKGEVRETSPLVIGSSPIGGATLHLRFLFSMKSSELEAFSSG
jgi:hypothetical protein